MNKRHYTLGAGAIVLAASGWYANHRFSSDFAAQQRQTANARWRVSGSHLSGEVPEHRESTESTAVRTRDAVASEKDQTPSPDVEVFARAAWGGKFGELGRERPEQANPEGPMSVAASTNGDVWILDQVNARLVHYDAKGAVASVVPGLSGSPQDLVAAPNGALLILDRLKEPSVSILSSDGAKLASLTLAENAKMSPGQIRDVFVHNGDVYVEAERTVRVGTLAGQPDPELTEIPGKPLPNGGYAKAFVGSADDGFYVTIQDDLPLRLRFTRAYRSSSGVGRIVALEADAAGIVYVATTQLDAAGAELGVQVTCIEPSRGEVVGTASLPPHRLPEESFREFSVLPAGGFVYAHMTEQGVELLRGHC